MASRRVLAVRSGAVALALIALAAIAAAAAWPRTATSAKAGPASTGHWVGTWAAAPMPGAASGLPPAPFRQPGSTFADSTIRQSIHVTAGGKRIRLRISNAYGVTSLPVTKVSVALPADGQAGVSAIQPGTSKAVTFGSSRSTDIPAKAQALSDPLDFPVDPNTNLAVTIYLAAGQSGRAITWHRGSRTNTFLVKGDHVSDTSLDGAARVPHWYFLSGLDAWEPDGTSAINAIGDSLTDGRGSTPNGDDKWTDQLFTRLRATPEGNQLAVLDQGIGGNRILHDGVGPSLMARLDRDALSQSGAKWLILWEGVNDIGQAPATPAAQKTMARDLIRAYQRIIRQAHSHGIKVYGVTITPFGGSKAYDDQHGYRQATRQTVNTWIRDGHTFDGVLDFDQVVRDPSNPKELNPAYDYGDHLHMNPAGYGAIAKSVPASLFLPRPAADTDYSRY